MHHDYESIVREALNEPGKLSQRDNAFWNYSLGNSWLAQLHRGRIEPISTFPGWKALGRYVKKGEKAIELLMPVIVKDKENDDEKKMIFVARRFWFGLRQTLGAEYKPEIPGFNIKKTVKELEIKVEPFEHPDGNCQGYAKTDQRIIAVSPVAYDSLKTAFHEIAHVLLHPKTVSTDSDNLTRDLKECEAELTSYRVCSSLDHTANLSSSRAYIQNWRADDTVEKIR